jgi:hypothetical protein
MKKIALLLARFFNPLAVLMLIQTLWGLIDDFLENNQQLGHHSSEMALMHHPS